MSRWDYDDRASIGGVIDIQSHTIEWPFELRKMKEFFEGSRQKTMTRQYPEVRIHLLLLSSPSVANNDNDE